MQTQLNRGGRTIVAPASINRNLAYILLGNDLQELHALPRSYGDRLPGASERREAVNTLVQQETDKLSGALLVNGPVRVTSGNSIPPWPMGAQRHSLAKEPSGLRRSS